MPIGFGPFAFDRQSRLLWRDGAEIALPPRVLGVLEVLIDRPGQVVARQDLLDGVWKDAFVTDTSLAEAVSFLRQALGDDPQAPRYIQTVHRRGYRFLAALTESADRRRRASDPGRATPRRRGSDPGRRMPALSAVGGVAVVAMERGGAVRSTCADRRSGGRAAVRRRRRRWSRASRSGPSTARRSIAARRRSRSRRTAGCSPGRRARPRPARAPSTFARWTAWTQSRLPGTDGAASPFFSPDGRWIGFFADGKLKKIAAAGGSPSIVADAPAPGGAAWGPDGRIAFAGTPAGGLSLVSDQGGAVTVLTTPRTERGELRHISSVVAARRPGTRLHERVLTGRRRAGRSRGGRAGIDEPRDPAQPASPARRPPAPATSCLSAAAICRRRRSTNAR